MTLKEQLMNLEPNVEGNWSVYADAPFTPESEARIGQDQFENGGLLDGKECVGSLEYIGGTGELEISNPEDPDYDPEHERELEVEDMIEKAEEYRLELEKIEREQNRMCT